MSTLLIVGMWLAVMFIFRASDPSLSTGFSSTLSESIFPGMDIGALAQLNGMKGAAVKAEGVRSKQQQLIWNALVAFPDGLTTEQICSITMLSSDSVRPRLLELDYQHRIERATKNGKPYHPILNKEVRTRINKLGNQMTVWLGVR